LELSEEVIDNEDDVAIVVVVAFVVHGVEDAVEIGDVWMGLIICSMATVESVVIGVDIGVVIGGLDFRLGDFL
jgi:hypothetical protein